MSTIRTLIVEDDSRIAKLHQRFTERVNGFEVVGIANGMQDAWDMVEVLKPDLILLDIYFPEGTSMEMLRDIRAKGLEIDIILITAAREMTPFKEALRGGVFDYIIKPVMVNRFQECLEKFRQYRQRLDTAVPIEQRDVDSLLRSPSFSLPTDNENTPFLPKGIDPLTLTKVQSVMNSTNAESGVSAEEVGSHIGASRSTARRYLEYMVSVGTIYPDVVYGSIGRPERKYFVK